MYNKRYAIIAFCLVFVFASFTFIEANETPEETHIKTYHEDITGDGHKEDISLYGTYLSKESDFYADIWAEITFPDQTEAKITYKGGYEPKLTFVDMNQNDRYDILFSSTINQEDNNQYYQIHTIKRHKPSDIELPSRDYIKGLFQNQFMVELQISPIGDPEVINVKNRAKQYIESDIYDEEGKLLQKTSVHPQSFIKYEPVFLSSRKGYGLKSHRQINGINKSDELGTIETLWYYENDKWIILHSKWIAATDN